MGKNNTLWRMNNPEAQLLITAKQRAKKFGLEINISKKDIQIPYLCPFLEEPLVRTVGEGHNLMAPSLDRIDNTKGYVKGNVQVISRLANAMKNSASPKQLKTFSKKVLQIYGES